MRQAATVTTTSLVLAVAVLPLFCNVYAQNFTQHVETDPGLQVCPNGLTVEQGGQTGFTCSQAIEVLFDSEDLLVMQSNYADIIWNAVHDAMERGYQIQDVQTYAAESRATSLSNPLTEGVTLLIMVIMTK
jgi:hypothetical protein